MPAEFFFTGSKLRKLNYVFIYTGLPLLKANFFKYQVFQIHKIKTKILKLKMPRPQNLKKTNKIKILIKGTQS